MDARKQRIYKLHYNLKKKGNSVKSSSRMVVKRAKEVSKIEQVWLNELIFYGYCVCDGLFTPPHFSELEP
ncbi:MAG: hypothetical protein BGN96_04585 [Bacteroidales bacterium 45-6]|nr:MAG: hypothetical protein BGN96_04585 [Bacteroidales bacterium 45-6]